MLGSESSDNLLVCLIENPPDCASGYVTVSREERFQCQLEEKISFVNIKIDQDRIIEITREETQGIGGILKYIIRQGIRSISIP